MLLFSRGQHETGWGLLADPCRPLPGLARCRRGRLPTAAAELLPRRFPLGSARQKPPERLLQRSRAAGRRGLFLGWEQGKL